MPSLADLIDAPDAATQLAPPVDMTAREHIGTVAAIKHRDAVSGFTIVVLKDSMSARGRDEAGELAVGQTFRFLGRWEHHERYGPQFRFDTFVIHEPATRAAVVHYLVKLCDDIGERKASRLWAAYGADTCRVLREQPDRPVADGILSQAVADAAAEELRKASEYESTKLDLYAIFAGRGFPGTLIDAAISTWGAKAATIIRRNPFALLVNELPGCGFKRCDKLFIDRGGNPAALKRQLLCMWNDVRTNSVGHTWHKVERLIDTLRSTVPGGVDPVRALRMGLRAKWLAKHRDSDGQLWIAEHEKATDELKIAQAVVRLTKN